MLSPSSTVDQFAAGSACGLSSFRRGRLLAGEPILGSASVLVNYNLSNPYFDSRKCASDRRPRAGVLGVKVVHGVNPVIQSVYNSRPKIRSGFDCSLAPVKGSPG